MMDPRHRQHRKKLYESLGLEDDDVIQPSTKMKALLALLKTNVRPKLHRSSTKTLILPSLLPLRQLAECPDDKIVVYSQWTTMLVSVCPPRAPLCGLG
jgi:SNF2 family DNA or RNA helicase